MVSELFKSASRLRAQSTRRKSQLVEHDAEQSEPDARVNGSARQLNFTGQQGSMRVTVESGQGCTYLNQGERRAIQPVCRYVLGVL